MPSAAAVAIRREQPPGAEALAVAGAREPLDEAVGVGQQAAVAEVDRPRLPRRIVDEAEREAEGKLELVRVGAEGQRHRMAGRDDLEPAGGIEAAGEDRDEEGLLGLLAQGDLVEQPDRLLDVDVDPVQRRPAAAQRDRERSRLGAVPADVADDEAHRAVGVAAHVEEVPAEEQALAAGVVGDVDAALEVAVEGARQQPALQAPAQRGDGPRLERLVAPRLGLALAADLVGQRELADAHDLVDDPGDPLERGELLGGPVARTRVDRADRAEDLAARGVQRPAGVGDHAHVGDRLVVLDARVLARVGDDQRRLGDHDVLAERVRQRGPAIGGDRLGHARRSS